MKKFTPVIVILASCALFVSLGSGCAVIMVSKHMNSDKDETTDKSQKDATPEGRLRSANAKFYSSINTMLTTGNTDSFSDVWSHRDSASNFGPSGARQVGWEEIDAQFKREGAMKMGGNITCEDMVVVLDNDGNNGYVTCVEVGNNMTIDGKTTQVRFRSTNIYQMENGKWKLVHHHTDVAPVLKGSASNAANVAEPKTAK
ncbi:MAG: nuclear transport factor 2 family protein [Planctomycetota bacterium]